MHIRAPPAPDSMQTSSLGYAWKDFSMPLSSRVGGVLTGLRRWFNAHRDGSSPKVDRQDLHLDERADETGLGEFRCLRSCFAQGQFPCTAEGLQYGNKARHVSRQAKPRRPCACSRACRMFSGVTGPLSSSHHPFGQSTHRPSVPQQSMPRSKN